MEQRLAIYELQDALAQILADRGLPGMVYPDGIFGPETAEAVRIFQKMEGLPQTGEVDQMLWELIQDRLTELIEKGKIQPLPVFPNDSFALQPGSSGLIAGLVQGILIQLAGEYHNIPKPQLSYTFDPTTVEAVKVIQQKSGLEPTGVVDRQTWNVMVMLYRHLE